MKETQHSPISEISESDPKIDKAKEILAGFNVPYREQETPIENYYRGKVLHKLQNIGVITITEKGLVFDKDKLANSEESKRRVDLGRWGEKRRLDILDYAKALDGVEIIDNSEKDQNDKKPTRPILVLPKNLKELETGEYQRNSSKAMIQPWEIGKQFTGWKNEIPMADGEKLTFSELAMAQALARVQARRNKNGDLEIYDEEKKDYVKFSGTLMKKVLGGSIGGSSENIYMNSLLFAKNQLPNLLRIGMLKESDFRTTADSSTAKIHNVHERRLNKTSGNVSFSNSHGQFARYYVGKEKLIGIGIPIDHEHMTARMLDKQNVAIVQDVAGEKTIVATFPLLGREQLSKIQEAVKKRLIERGIELSPKNITSNTTIGGDKMKNLMKKYSVTDFLKARSGEDPADYYKRLKPLDNPDFVLKKVTGFFQQAGIGIHNLPWSEQLVLARALLEKNDEQKLLEHAKKYGLPGVRAFLSLDLDASLGQKIVKIGERLDQSSAKEVFQKYSEIVDAANSTSEYLQKITGEELSTSAQNELRESFLKRAKNFLAEVGSKQLDGNELSTHLENIKVEIMLLTATFRAYKQEKGAIDFSELKGLSLIKISSAELAQQPDFVKSIEQMYEENYKNYPTEFRHALINGFNKALSSQNTSWYLLKFNNKLIASARFDEVKDRSGKVDHLYFGSVNSNPKYAGGKLGEAMVEQALKLEAEAGLRIEADCDPNAPISKKYLEMGFVATTLEDYNGVNSFHIQLDRIENTAMASKKMSQEAIVALAPLGEVRDYRMQIIETSGRPDFGLLQKGYVLTRYFISEGKTYCVFQFPKAEALDKAA